MHLVSLVIGLNIRAFCTVQQVEIFVSLVTKHIGICGIHFYSLSPKATLLLYRRNKLFVPYRKFR